MAKKKKSTEQKETLMTTFRSFNWPDVDRAFDNFRRDFERSFMTFPVMSSQSISAIPITHADLIDEGNEFIVKVDLPGVKKKDIKLNVTDNSLEISAKHREEEKEKRKNFLRKERSEISYYRTLPLPEKVVSTKTKAKLMDGVLNITIPKIIPTSKPKKKLVSIQ